MGKKNTKDEYGLTAQQRAFADAFLVSDNKKQSAIKAGVKPSSAGVIAARLSTNVNVLTYLAMRRGVMAQKLEDNFTITTDRLIRELAAIALFDPAKMYDENGDLLPINKMDEMTRRAIAAVDVKELLDEDGTLTGYSKKVRTASKIAAIELLGRNLAMWGEKDGGALSILNINIVTHENQLDHPAGGKVIENGQA